MIETEKSMKCNKRYKGTAHELAWSSVVLLTKLPHTSAIESLLLAGVDSIREVTCRRSTRVSNSDFKPNPIPSRIE